jgi:hypothetical protein
MPINFPTSPTNNETYSYNGRTWKYSSSANVWSIYLIDGTVNLGITRDSFIGDGSNNAFTLSVIPINEDHCSVYVDRVLQRNNEYSVVYTTLTFTTAPEANSVIDIYTAAGTNVVTTGITTGKAIAMTIVFGG